MRSTKLILVEGIPGSGKSTTGQFLSRRLTEAGVPVQWWYEEMSGHPLYIFDDEASIQAVVDDLFAGRFARVVDATVEKWRQFAESLRAFDGIVILDSTFLGHLTWTLFGFEAPAGMLEAYLAAVTHIIEPCDPIIIYVRHADVEATMTSVCAVRGAAWTDLTIRKATQSPYGKRVKLAGFDGLVAYWKAYRDISDGIVAATAIPTLKIDTSEQDWPRYYAELAQFLDLAAEASVTQNDDDLSDFVGEYAYRDGEVEKTCAIRLENGDLIARDAPRLWPWNRLIRASGDTYVAASFPIEITFERAPDGTIVGAAVSGEELLDGKVQWQLRRLTA